ncbi:MAG: cytochrome c3 family protein [Deltaproteobacteria bacterium]|nr:cytochrome c3 family protein [Deltaproteobacteria bacterium]
MKFRVVAFAISILALAAVLHANDVANRGEKELSLWGGKRGNVPFPHHLHQNNLGDCNTCHDLFPQESGVIKALKKDEKLKPKQVMNKLCVKCHREQAKAGNPSGPRSCNACHIKDLQPPA